MADDNEHLDEHLNEHLEVNLNDRENVVIELIKADPYITYNEVSAKLNVSTATTRRIFSKERHIACLINEKYLFLNIVSTY